MDQKIRPWPTLPCSAMAMLALCAAPAPAAAQVASGQASSTIWNALVLNSTQPLHFGNIIPGLVVSDFQLNENNGAITVLTGDALPAGGSPSRAAFVASAPPFSRLQITIPAGFINITRVGGTETMRVANFRLEGNRNRDTAANGLLLFHVGARLRVNPNQARGVYRGQFNVTVDYR